VKADLSIRTKDDGTFSVDLPPGFYDVFVAVPAFNPMCRKVRIKPGAAVDTTFRMNADPLYAAEMGNRVDGVPRETLRPARAVALLPVAPLLPPEQYGQGET